MGEEGGGSKLCASDLVCIYIHDAGFNNFGVRALFAFKCKIISVSSIFDTLNNVLCLGFYGTQLRSNFMPW